MLKVGVQSAGWYNQEDPLASFEYIKECGFEAVDFNIDHYFSPGKMSKEGKYSTVFDGSVEEVLEFFTPLKEASEKTGVIISQMHAPFPIWFEDKDDVNEYSVDVLDKCFAVCEYVSCPAIVVHSVKRPTKKQEYETNLEIYRGLIPHIKKYKGVKICLENLFSRRGPRIIEAGIANGHDICGMIDILNKEAGGDYFGFCFDTGHANMTGHKIRDYINDFGDKISVLHIHDNNGLEDFHMVPYSYLISNCEHSCDWNGFVEGLKDVSYNGTLSFETFRIFSAYPAEVHTEVLKLIAAIGKYWVKELNS
ncbi:MAG: sugar phosphate isomerase/epimerase [Ruminococcaceae bacterium]|nr:sugar phosphate isomerase/epimerase [Oscillospiraceae bacterium]